MCAQRLPYSWLLPPTELPHAVNGVEMRVGVEEEPLEKSRLNDLSLLTESGPLNKSAIFVLAHVCLPAA